MSAERVDRSTMWKATPNLRRAGGINKSRDTACGLSRYAGIWNPANGMLPMESSKVCCLWNPAKHMLEADTQSRKVRQRLVWLLRCC